MRTTSARRSRGPAIISVLAIAMIGLGTVAPATLAAPKGQGKGPGRKDSTPPAVAIASPSSGATVSGSITVAGSASDNVGVASVTVRIDGGAAQTAAGTTSWTFSLDSTSLADGTHSITSTATDPAGNSTSATVTIDVANAPAPSPEPDPAPSPSPSPTPPPSDGAPVPAPALNPGSIGGWTFKDLDRDGVYEEGEQPFASQHLYLFTPAGVYLGQAYSDQAGWYAFTGLADGDYRVEYDASSWSPIRHEWVPTTTGSVRPSVSVSLAGTALAHFGWRPVVWSTDAASPIETLIGPTGLRVQTYNDAVPAQAVYDAVMSGTVGEEAAHVTIRFALGTVSATSTGVVLQGGVYKDYSATCYVSYDAWLDTASYTIGHEYGHAWSWYYAYIARQDPTMSGYLEARGLDGDPRVGSSYAWGVGELIAEDYRQLLGPPAGRAYPQANKDVPPAAQVPGLAEYLTTSFVA